MKTYTTKLLLKDKQRPYRIGSGIVLISYIVIYSFFLYGTDFLPYIFDNNETFSSLIHAQNLYNFGLKDSFGLTDEAYSLLQAAHPYVYTHQGNFPRLYAFLLYCLGAKSPESQIIITTFTIGLAGIWFCYHYFAKYISSLFAAIYCLLLMTDYIMFMQWQVNTWRVWHLFFFFSSFLCCHGLEGKYRKVFIAVSIINFSCLFYMEISYATFVFITSSIYLFLSQSTHSRRRNILNFFVFGTGAALGIGILIGQNIAYQGWDVFIQDLSYTFIARNQYSVGDQNKAKQILEFYSKNNIVFWSNFNSIVGLRRPLVIIENFYYYCLSSYTPFLTLTSVIVVLSTSLSYFCGRTQTESRVMYFLNATVASKEKTIPSLMTILFLLSVVLLTLATYPSTWKVNQIFLELTKPLSIGSAMLLGVLFFKFSNKFLSKKTTKKSGLVNVALSIFFVLVICTSYLLILLSPHYPRFLTIIQEYSPLISDLSSCIPIFMGGILFVSSFIIWQSQDPQYINQLQTFTNIVPFTISTFLGFICSYLIFPGYIITAYWQRYCPFTVFAHIALYAWLFYVLTTPHSQIRKIFV